MNIADIKKATETTAPMGSLRRDSLVLLVAMILVGVIAAVTLSIVSYYNLTKNAERDSQVLVKSAGALVSGFFEEPFSMIRCISVSSDKMQEEGDPNIDLMLESNLRDSPSFDSLMVLDRSGVITHIAPYDAFYMGRNMSGFRFFSHSMKSDSPSLSDVYLSPISGAPTVIIAMRNERGLAAGALSLKGLSEKIDLIRESSNFMISIIDSDGVYIVDPDNSMVKRSVVSPDFGKIRAEAKSDFTFVTMRDGKEYLATATRLKDTGWYVIVYYDRSVIAGSVRNALFISIAGFVFLLILTVVYKYESFRKMMHFIRSFTEFSRKVGEGDYGATFQSPHIREFLVLMEDLDKMRSRIDERETALCESERKFREIIMNIPVALGIMDLNERITFLNPAFVELFGYDCGDIPILEEWYIKAYPDEEYRSGIIAFYKDHIPLGGVLSLESVVTCKNGDRRNIVASTTIYDGMTYNVFSDITSRVEAEKAINELNRDLETRVAERTAQLEELNADLTRANNELEHAMSRLTAAQDSLVEKEKMAVLGQLAAGIAHEINSPLGAIVSSNETICRNFNKMHDRFYSFYSSLTQDEVRFFEMSVNLSFDKTNEDRMHQRRMKAKRVYEALTECGIGYADELSDLLADLGLHDDVAVMMNGLRGERALNILQMVYLMWSFRMSTQIISQASEKAAKVISSLKIYLYPAKSETPEVTDLTVTIDAIIDLYYYKLRNGIKVERRYSQVPSVECYPDKLGQVWTNLINNAIHAMNNAGTLEIEVTRDDTNVVVSFTDSGCGIPENIRGLIFNPLFTTKKPGEGTGLGLDIVRRIVEFHRGRIECDSRPGRTTFTVSLPFKLSN